MSKIYSKSLHKIRHFILLNTEHMKHVLNKSYGL